MSTNVFFVKQHRFLCNLYRGSVHYKDNFITCGRGKVDKQLVAKDDESASEAGRWGAWHELWFVLNAVFYHSLLADLLPHMITPATKLNSSLRATYVLLYPETARFRHLRKGRKRVIYVAKCNVHVHFLLVELKTCNLCLFRAAPRLPVVGRKCSYKAT